MDYTTVKRRRHVVAIHVVMLILAGAALFSLPVQAGDLKAFNDSVAKAYRNFRGAMFYVRTENLSVATFELEDMRDAWRAVETRFGDAPPDAFAADPAWRETLREIGARADKALKAADDGDLRRIASTIAPIRGLLAGLRARNGVYVFADCINEANAAGDALMTFRARPHKFDDEVWVNRLLSQAAVVSYVYAKCGRAAPAALRDDAVFNRMIDGAVNEMPRIRGAIATKNSRLLAIILGEFRSFDQILFLKFG